MTLPRRCPNCGSRLRTLPVLYGYPTPEAMQAARRKEILLGGCIPSPDGHSRVCRICELPPVERMLPDTDEPWRLEERAFLAAQRAHCRRLAGGVWGHLIGDAVGVPYEFKEPSQIGFVRFTGYGTHHQPPGTWSDDGALMLALLHSLLRTGFNPADQGRRFLAWQRRGSYTPDRDGAFDIGGATAAALDRLGSGTPALDAGGTGERDLGNGSLMRILPIALADPRISVARLVDHAQQASRLTHGHPRAQVACALYVLVARELLRGALDRNRVLSDAIGALRSHYALSATSGSDQPGAAYDAELDVLLGWTGRSGAGYVVDAFWSAWDAFAGADSYRSTIKRAIGYGHDTDTTAAIAGGLAGIYWGVQGIPRAWLVGLRGSDIVEPLIHGLIRQASMVPYPPGDDALLSGMTELQRGIATG